MHFSGKSGNEKLCNTIGPGQAVHSQTEYLKERGNTLRHMVKNVQK